MANCGGTLANFFSDSRTHFYSHSLTWFFSQSTVFFTWFFSRWRGRTLLLTKTRIQGCTVLGSNAMHQRILARAWEASPEVEILQHEEHVQILLNLMRSFFFVGHSRGSQTRGSRGTRGSQGNNGHRGRTGKGPNSGSSTVIHAPTRGENVPPRSPTRRTSRPHSPARDVPQGSEHDERR
jgi:hypothetical protein